MTTSIQEALLCPFTFQNSLHVAVILRRGRECVLYTVLKDLQAGISTSFDGLQTFREVLNLPCRVLDGQEGALLARKTILSEHQGRPSYRL